MKANPEKLHSMILSNQVTKDTTKQKHRTL